MELLTSIENLNNLLKRHPEIVKDSLYTHAFFDADDNLYVATLKNITDSHRKARWGFTKDDRPKELCVYSYHLLNQKIMPDENVDVYANERIAYMIYHVDVEQSKDKTELESVMNVQILNTKENFSRKGIASNMLKLLEYYAIVEGVKHLEIECISPFSYAADKWNSVKDFYATKNNYVVQESQTIKNLIYGVKQMNSSFKNDIKDKIINIPVDNNNYIVLLPKKMLASTGFKGREPEGKAK